VGLSQAHLNSAVHPLFGPSYRGCSCCAVKQVPYIMPTAVALEVGASQHRLIPLFVSFPVPIHNIPARSPVGSMYKASLLYRVCRLQMLAKRQYT
jgi:hypothetical protein